MSFNGPSSRGKTDEKYRPGSLEKLLAMMRKSNTSCSLIDEMPQNEKDFFQQYITDVLNHKEHLDGIFEEVNTKPDHGTSNKSNNYGANLPQYKHQTNTSKASKKILSKSEPPLVNKKNNPRI